MKVKELIEQLTSLPQDLDVLVLYPDIVHGQDEKGFSHVDPDGWMEVDGASLSNTEHCCGSERDPVDREIVEVFFAMNLGGRSHDRSFSSPDSNR
ncbi:MAG: hypothetical protein O7J95_14770 [Planctomycetota bacterium]|nr:hypothetical protein [Planctomycetota bacterium]